MKKIPLFKAQNVQQTHPGKFVSKFADNIKKPIDEENQEDFFDNLKDFVDEIQLNVGGSNNNELSPLKNNKSENLFITKPKDDQLLKGENTGILRPMLQVKNIKIRSNNDENQNQLNTFIQNLYKRYIKKKKKQCSQLILKRILWHMISFIEQN